MVTAGDRAADANMRTVSGGRAHAWRRYVTSEHRLGKGARLSWAEQGPAVLSPGRGLPGCLSAWPRAVSSADNFSLME